MKRQSVAVLFCTLVLACLVTIIVLQVLVLRGLCLENDEVVDVATFGDSMTDGGHSGETLDCTSWSGFGYQQYMRKRLQVNARIRNFGIGGQTSAQVAARITSTLQTDYLVFFAGTNDVWTWDSSSSNDTVPQSVARALARQPLVRRGRVLVATVPPACQAPVATPWREGAPEALNEAIWANATTSLYEVVDLYTLLVMPGTRWRHPAYCKDDYIHLTEAANEVVGEAFANAMRR
jgi:lysophospholipase L1-like esterase